MNHSTDNPGNFVLLAPFTGPVVPLAERARSCASRTACSATASASIRSTGVLVAPCDGTITHLARTASRGDAALAEGAEILLHIGIDTVELNGKGFTPKVEQGAACARRSTC